MSRRSRRRPVIARDVFAAALWVARPSAVQALTPPLDQTRTVGLVTLPGAFVGVLIGGGDAGQAGAAQLLVLVGLLAAETVAVVITIELVARPWICPMITSRKSAGTCATVTDACGDFTAA